MSVTSCFYIFVRPIPEEGQPELPREGFGYISRQIGVDEPPAYRQCAWYDQSEREEFFKGDSMWQAGRAMSLLAVGIGFIVMCIVLCTCCVAFELPTFDGLFWTCMLCFVAQALTFLSWGSDLCEEYECTWSSGTGMNITAAMFWVWAANMVKSFPEALPPRGRKSSKRGRENTGEDEQFDDNEDSPYLAGNRGFQDEYPEEGDDEFNDWGEENQYDQEDENYDYNNEEQGYYDDDGNWYSDDYDPQQQGSYYEGEGDEYADYDEQQQGSYYGEEEYQEDPNYQDGGYDYDGGQELSPEEMEYQQTPMHEMD